MASSPSALRPQATAAPPAPPRGLRTEVAGGEPTTSVGHPGPSRLPAWLLPVPQEPSHRPTCPSRPPGACVGSASPPPRSPDPLPGDPSKLSLVPTPCSTVSGWPLMTTGHRLGLPSACSGGRSVPPRLMRVALVLGCATHHVQAPWVLGNPSSSASSGCVHEGGGCETPDREHGEHPALSPGRREDPAGHKQAWAEAISRPHPNVAPGG